MDEVVAGAEIIERIAAVLPGEPDPPSYADGSGEIGVITSVSSPFCGDCGRARLTTEGALVTCLFADGGVDLRGPMRAGADDDAIREIIASTWASRDDRYSEEHQSLLQIEGAGKKNERVEMYQIGGLDFSAVEIRLAIELESGEL